MDGCRIDFVIYNSSTNLDKDHLWYLTRYALPIFTVILQLRGIFLKYTKFLLISLISQPQYYQFSLLVGYMAMKFRHTQLNEAIAISISPC